MKRRQRVLIVDDDAGVVLGLARALYADNERYDVLLARNGEIAQQIMRELPVNVLVTDLGLPGLSGMDLICWTALERPETRVAVITAQDLGGLREQIHRQGVLHVVQKPLVVDEVRALINSLLSDRGLSGDLSRLSVVDVIQMLCLGRQTTGLRLVQGATAGLVLIESGQIVHAVWAEKEGLPAFFEIVRAREGLFNTTQFPASPPRTVQGHWQYLLMEGARLEDEARGSRPGLATELDVSFEGPAAVGPSPIPTPAPVRPAADRGEVERLVQAGFDLLRRSDYEGARRQWVQAEEKDPENNLVKVNLRKLERMLAARPAGGSS